MKAALLYEKEDLRLIELPIPTIEPNEILMRVKAAKICPTDIRKYTLGSKDARIRSLPMNLCHEFAGDIVDVGDEVSSLKKGMRITGYGFAGNAEYVKLQPRPENPYFANAILELPPHMSYEEGAFITPLSECIHSVVDQANLRFGDTIAIIGAGHMGLQQVNIAHWCGAHVIAIDLLDERLEIAKQFGADATINPTKENVVEAVKKVNDNHLANSSIATLGSPEVIQTAIDVTGNAARIVLFGGCPTGVTMRFNPNDIHYHEKLLVGIEGIGVHPNRRPERRKQALRHIASDKIDVKKLITHVLPLTEIVEAYEMIRLKKALSIVLTP